MYAATSKVENSAHGSSCQLKFVYGKLKFVLRYFSPKKVNVSPTKFGNFFLQKFVIKFQKSEKAF